MATNGVGYTLNVAVAKCLDCAGFALITPNPLISSACAHSSGYVLMMSTGFERCSELN